MTEDDDFDIDAWVEVRFLQHFEIRVSGSSKSGFGCLVLGFSFFGIMGLGLV